jgi:hypothetical protein
MSADPRHPRTDELLNVSRETAEVLLKSMGYAPVGDGTYVHRDFKRLWFSPTGRLDSE